MSDQKANSILFSDFNPVNPTEWKDKMVQDLKGLTYEKLIWKTNDGIEVKPFYTAEDLENLKYLNTKPGEFPYVRGSKKFSNSWEIRQDIKVEDVETANATALHALNWGATSIGFIIPEGKTLSSAEFKRLLKDIYFDCININFLSHTNSTEIFNNLASEAKSLNIEPARIIGSIDNDPLGYLTKNGRFAHSESEEFRITSSLLSKTDSLFPNLKTLGIDGQIFHNAGATITQELGFCLAMISDYMDLLSKEGVKPEIATKHMQLNLSVGPIYFMEIAKIRAARFLFAKLAGSWGISDEEALKIFIHSNTSDWNQTLYDPYVNMLRSTTESMSAVMGGCDSLTISPFDKAFRETTKFSERIARNTHIILKEEAWFDKVLDPAAGSYFIESLTDSVIEESWKVFLEIEELGGYLAAFKAGEVQKRIKASASLRDQNIAARKEVLLGSNQFPNLLDNKPEDMVMNLAFPRNEAKVDLLAEPLKIYRGAMPFEELRMVSEKNPKKVFLLTVGNPVWRKARAGFSTNFFGCAGFEIIDNHGFDSLDEGLKAAEKEKASIIVLCSSDEEYAGLAPEAFGKIAKDTILVVAGFPKDCIEDLKLKGIQNFIHMKSNVLDELRRYQKILGM